jgi:probable HAF family extracellular repeat protein
MFQIRSAVRLCAVWTAAFACALASQLQAAPSSKWSIVELGALGSRGAMPNAINNRGDIVGTSNANTGTPLERQHAFLWSNGVIQDLGRSFGNPPGSANSGLGALNDHGTMIGSVDGRAYIWQDGAASPLPFEANVRDINKSGAIVGSHSVLNPRGFPEAVSRAFLFRDGVFQELGTLGGQSSTANAVNDKGVVAGTSSLGGFESPTHGFVYEDGVMKDLGTLGGAESFVRDINNHGVIVGTAQEASGRFVAVAWDPRSGIRRLMDAQSNAIAINDHGAILIGATEGSYVYEDGMLTKLEAIPAVAAAGWTRLFPSAINDRGWITGYGYKAGGPAEGSAFVLMPR